MIGRRFGEGGHTGPPLRCAPGPVRACRVDRCECLLHRYGCALSGSARAEKPALRYGIDRAAQLAANGQTCPPGADGRPGAAVLRRLCDYSRALDPMQRRRNNSRVRRSERGKVMPGLRTMPGGSRRTFNPSIQLRATGHAGGRFDCENSGPMMAARGVRAGFTNRGRRPNPRWSHGCEGCP